MKHELRIKEKKKVLVIINTSNNLEVSVGLEIDGKKDEIKETIGREKAQIVLPIIETLLKKHKLQLTDITAIRVNQGPGSFTGVRVGVSIANALAYTLKIPVNNRIGVFVEPTY